MKIKERLSFQPKFIGYSLKNKIKKLQLGCGQNLIDGFFNTDINTKNGAYYVDATKPLPFFNNTFHYIFSEHNFEHLSYTEGKKLLGECYRVLRPKGVIRITMPCLEFLIDIYNNIEKPENKEYLKWHFERYAKEQFEDFGEDYPAALFVNNFMRFWGHKCLYDKPTIRRMFENAGFKNVVFCNIFESAHEELQNVEHHQNIIPPRFNALESMCVEAMKI